MINEVKLIAEPWDVGEGGYQVGNFPPQWSEWNGRYRDSIRDFWRGTPEPLADFGYRLTGSSDLYASNGRRPYASVNFVTAHDGFTMADLVAYDEKHNEANGEDNRDGESHNRSWNHGAEGPTDDPAIHAARSRDQRNLLATLFLSQGVPMLLGGDEIGRTQLGNNNGYAQDNEISWFDWEHADTASSTSSRRLIAFRHDHPAFRRRRWFHDRPIHGDEAHEIEWFAPDGTRMGDDHWHDPLDQGIGVFISGAGLVDVDGLPVTRRLLLPGDQSARRRTRTFALPNGSRAQTWQVCLDTAATRPFPARGRRVEAGAPSPCPVTASSSCAVARHDAPRDALRPAASAGPGDRPRTVPRATYRLQLRPGVRVPRGRRHRRLPRATRGQPRLRLADPPGGDRQRARLRRRGSTAGQRRARRRPRPSPSSADPRPPPPRPGRRHRPQPHGDPGRREPLVVGRPRERPVEPLRALLRRRLGPARGPPPQPRPPADPRRPLRPRPRGRRAAPGPGGRFVRDRLPRSPRPGRAAGAGRARRGGRALGRIRTTSRSSAGPSGACRRRPRSTARASSGATATRRSCGSSWRASRRNGPRSRAPSRRRPRRSTPTPTRSTRSLARQNYRLASLAGGGPRPRLPAVLRRRRAWSACAWRTRRSSRTRTPWSCAGSATG